MSCGFPGVLQPSCLAEAAFLHTSKLSSLQQFDVRWANGESRIAELLSRIQPNGHSESQRKAVADYVSGLVRKCLDCEVFRFGSVPLKTYLPDGDIDLTAFCSHQELRDSWALDVQTVLEHEVQRKDADFTVSNVQCIHAEVKIVKCVVENVVVDISFNQLGGLCTLCFLEEVDRLIQKNHLFKRSIILVKAWCYYESRILGAHHALISTYALETLVLYIFNVFHSTLRGPLEVLFTFLDYFSKFDWENYCVSLWGPVPLAAQPDLTAEPPLKEGSKLLLSKGFLEACSALYDVFPKGGDTQARTFSGKYLNIVDPLRINNNLGRSVSQANFHRIKKAFRLGAHQLEKMFEVVDEDFLKRLDGFFSNTWERHQSGNRPDAPTSFFLPSEKFVYKTGCFDMLGDVGAKCLFTSPELKRSGLLSTEKISENSSHFSDSGTLMEDIRMETAERKSGGDLHWQESKSLKEFSDVKENQVHSGHDGITHLICPVGDGVPKTSVIMQSTITCNMPLAFSTDSQLRTSSLRKTSLDEGQSMEACKVPASLKLSTSERGHKKRLDADMIKSCGSPETLQQIAVGKSPLKKDSQGGFKSGCSLVESGRGGGMSKAGISSSGFSNVFMSKAASDTFAAMHGQDTGNIGFVRGKSWPTFNSCDNNQISAAITATSNNVRTGSTSSASEDLITSDTTMQKPPNFLFPESRDMLYALYMPSNLPPPVSSSFSSVVASSPFPQPSTFLESDGEKTQDLACASFVQVKPCKMLIETSQGPASEDVQSLASPLPQLHEPTISQTSSQHQVFEEQKQQFQFLQQPEQAWLQSNVDWEHTGMYLFSPNNESTTLAEANRGNDGSNIMGSVNGHMAIPSEVQEFSRTGKTDEKVQPSVQGYYDAHHLSADVHKGTGVTMYSLPVIASDPDACFYSDVPHLSDNTASTISSCENLPINAPSCCHVLPTTGIVSKATIPGFSEGLISVGAIGQQPFNFVDTFQSALLEKTTVNANSVQEGGNYIAQGSANLCSPTGAIPVVSYYNPFYPVFPAHSFSPHIPYEHKVFLDGMPREKLPPEYYGSGQIPESTAAALNARFASLSAEESGIEPSRDLLRSDLANHLRNLEFGRWCQEPVLQPLLKPPPIYHGGQDPYLWGVAQFTPLQGSCNQMIDSSNGLVPVLIAPQNVGGMSHVVSCPGTSDIGHLQNKETGTGTFLPVRNDMYRDPKPLSPQIAWQHEQGPMQKTHFSSTSHTSAAPALVASASCGGAYNALTNVQAFTNTAGEHGAIASHFSNHLESTGRVLPLVAGQLEFGSLGPIDITSFPCSSMGTRQSNRTNTGSTSSDRFPPFFGTENSNKALLSDKLRERS